MSSKARFAAGQGQNVTIPVTPVAPNAPTGFVANPDLTSVALDWNNNTELDLASYKVYMATGLGSFSLNHTVTAPTSTYTVTGLTSSTTYSFYVTAFSTHSLESDPSTTLTVTTDAATGGSTLTTFDRTGTVDISDALETWLNNNANVPDGTGASTPTRIKFPRFQADGVTRAKYRIEGGVSGGVNLGGMTDITFDGGGTPGKKGLDGAQFVQTSLNAQGKPAVFVVIPDPATNPEGFYDHNGGQLSSVPPYASFVTYALGAVVANGDRRWKSKAANNVGHDPSSSPGWWTNLSPDGLLTSRHNVDFVTKGVKVGDKLLVRCGPNLHKVETKSLHLTHNSYLLTDPAGGFDLSYDGALITCAAAGFPTDARGVIVTYVNATTLAMNGYYTGTTGNTNVNFDNTNFSVRDVIAVGYGGNRQTIAYVGASLGSAIADLTLNPQGQWNIQYTPTDTFVISYNDYDTAVARCYDRNRNRSMFIVTDNTRFRWRGFQFTGSFNHVFDGTTSGWDGDYEAQDAIAWRKSNDCEVGDCTIEKFWGNGMEMMQFDNGDGTLTGNRGIWLHDSKLQNFGRQSLSLTIGYNAIIEDTYLGESNRSLIDCEPSTSRIPTGTSPILQWTMQDVHLLRCTIGGHALGMLSCHEGLGRVHVDSCTGKALGTSGVAVVDKIIFENCVEAPLTNTSFPFSFDTGVHKGGDSIVIRNNTVKALTDGVRFLISNGSCTNYLVTGNDFGTDTSNRPIAQFTDQGTWAGTFAPFNLPVPAHALRDLVVAPPVAPSAPKGLVANPTTTTVALDWNTNPESDLASYNVYRLISSVWTLIHTVTAPTSAYTVTGLSASTSYSFRVTAVDSGGLESTPSATVTVTTDNPAAPAAPTGFTANPAATSVALDWANNSESDLASYKVYRLIGSTWTLIQTVTAPTSLYNVTGLTASTTYQFRVTAVSTVPLESNPAALTTTTLASGGTTAPTNVVAVALRGGVACSWTAPTGTSFTHYELSVYGMVAGVPTAPTAPNSPSSHTVLFPARRMVTSASTWAAITGASNVDSSGWLNSMFSTAQGGFANTYECRVRGYDSATNTFGPYSAYSNAVAPSRTTRQGTFTVGAKLPDGTNIGVPAGFTLTAYTGPTTIASGTVTNKFFALNAGDGITVTGPVSFVNCFFYSVGNDAIDGNTNGTNSGPMIHNASGSIVTCTNCEFDGGGPGGYGTCIDWANFNVQKCIFHGTSAFSLYAGSGCNVTINQCWCWDQGPWAYVEEAVRDGGAHFAHRDCINIFGDSNGGSTITNNVLELHSDQNAVIMAQPSQGAINKVHTWNGNWLDGGGGWQYLLDERAAGNTGTFHVHGTRSMRWPYGFWNNGPFAGTNANPTIVQKTATGCILDLGSPDTNVWWEPGFARPNGM